MVSNEVAEYFTGEYLFVVLVVEMQKFLEEQLKNFNDVVRGEDLTNIMLS